MKIFSTLLVSLVFSSQLFAQQAKEQKVFTQDIDNFWIAFDSAKTTTDSATQVAILQTMYVDKGTPGLRAFMEVRDYNAVKWVKLIRRLPKFWNSIRPFRLVLQ